MVCQPRLTASSAEKEPQVHRPPGCGALLSAGASRRQHADRAAETSAHGQARVTGPASPFLGERTWSDTPSSRGEEEGRQGRGSRILCVDRA